jgi:hypothetical protein
MRGPVEAWEANDKSLHATPQECRAHEITRILVKHQLIKEITTVTAFIEAAVEIENLYK